MFCQHSCKLELLGSCQNSTESTAGPTSCAHKCPLVADSHLKPEARPDTPFCLVGQDTVLAMVSDMQSKDMEKGCQAALNAGSDSNFQHVLYWLPSTAKHDSETVHHKSRDLGLKAFRAGGIRDATFHSDKFGQQSWSSACQSKCLMAPSESSARLHAYGSLAQTCSDAPQASWKCGRSTRSSCSLTWEEGLWRTVEGLAFGLNFKFDMRYWFDLAGLQGSFLIYLGLS